MNKVKTTVILALYSIGLLSAAGMVLGDDDHERERDYGHEREHSFFSRLFERDHDKVSNPQSEQYIDECGSCHFPYQPGFLSAPSWETVMGGLEDHFGENAELPEDDRSAVLKFLLDNAAGRVNRGLPNKILGSQKGLAMPIRITETRYFTYEHSEIPRRMVEENPEVNSFSNCDSCHRQAKQGLYDDDYVRIPGYGHWDD